MAFLSYISETIWLNICAGVIFSKISVTYSYRPFLTSTSPEVWLSSYQESDTFENNRAEPEFRSLDQFQNYYISKFNKTDYVITEDIVIIFFKCQAKYPVKWSLPHKEQIKNQQFYLFETSTSRSSNFDKIQKPEPTNEKYQTTLKISLDYVLDIFSVNLTCELADPKAKLGQHTSESKSIHVFYAGKHAIENQGSTIKVKATPNNKQFENFNIVLPCRPATPTVPILLEKLMDNSSNTKNKWKRLKYPTRYLKFDPKIGFVMEKNIVQEINIFGLYRCTALDKGDDVNEIDNGDLGENNTQYRFMYVNVTLTNDSNINTGKIQFKKILNLKGDATVAYNHEIFGNQKNLQPNPSFQDNEFLCCSGVENMAPLIYSEYCIGYLQCEILKWSMFAKLQWNISFSFNILVPSSDVLSNHSDCSTTIYLNGPVIFCEGENVQFADHFVKVFTEGLMPISNRSQGRSNEVLQLSVFESETGNFEMSRKIFLTIGYPITFQQLDEDDGEQYHYDGILELRRFDGYSNIEYDYIDDEIVEDLRKTEFKTYSEYPRDHFYDGELLVPICLGWSSMYSSGSYVGINFRNGTRQILNLKERSLISDVYLSEGIQTRHSYEDRKQLMYTVGRNVVADREMMSMDCWMPQWNTDKWDKITRNFKVLEAVPPTFEDNGYIDAEEGVYFYLGEVGKELIWTVKGGAPEARIRVTKDGKNILTQFQHHVNNATINDTFESFFTVAIEKDTGTIVEIGDGTTTIVRIKFRKISHEIQGVYQCTIQNVAGSKKRIIRVIIAGRGNALLYILLVTTMTSSAILIVLGLRHWRQRKQVIILRTSERNRN